MAKSPDAFRTISEVAEWLETPAHVLRFWEARFAQVKPVKRAGGRRYYRPADMLLLGGIKRLLHEDDLSIKEAQKVLRERGVKYVASLSASLEPEETESDGLEEAIPEILAPSPEEPDVEAPSLFGAEESLETEAPEISQPEDLATEDSAPEDDVLAEEPEPNADASGRDTAQENATQEADSDGNAPEQDAPDQGEQPPLPFQFHHRAASPRRRLTPTLPESAKAAPPAPALFGQSGAERPAVLQMLTEIHALPADADREHLTRLMIELAGYRDRVARADM